MPHFTSGDTTVEAVQFVGQVVPGLEREEGGDLVVRSRRKTFLVTMGDYVVLRDGQPHGIEPRAEFEHRFRPVERPR